jgi:hypothetical protein
VQLEEQLVMLVVEEVVVVAEVANRFRRPIRTRGRQDLAFLYSPL